MRFGLEVLTVIWVMCSLFTYITAPRKMTVSDYKGGALAVNCCKMKAQIL